LCKPKTVLERAADQGLIHRIRRTTVTYDILTCEIRFADESSSLFLPFENLKQI
jgi:hypothetical protein